MADGRSGWAEMAAFYDRTRAFPGDGETRVPAAVAGCLGRLGARRVLDVGCGTGRLMVPLVAAGLGVVGVDRSAEMLAEFAAKPGFDRLCVVRADAERLPFARAFDAALFSHVLHLAPRLDVLAGELRRVLRPGARLVVVDTTFLPQPATERVLALTLPLLRKEYVRWPRGEDSRDRRLLAALAGHLGAGDAEVVPVGEFPSTTSLARVLADVRNRTWWTFRSHDAAATARAADHAERALVAEGADLDAEVSEPAGVRLLVARLPD